MALKGHFISGGLVGPLAGIESGSPNDIAGFDGSGNAGTRSLSDLLDAVFSNTQGSVLYRGSSAWAALAPGTSGQFLKTQGAGANPVWGTVATPVDTKIETRTSLSGNQSFTGLAGYQTVGLVFDGVTKASGGKLAIRVSTDNGSTFKSASGDYYVLSSTTLRKTDTTELLLHSVDDTGPSYGTFIISQFSLATPKVMRGSFNFSYSVAATTPLNAIQLLSVGAGGAINGGTVHLVGIPGS